MQEVSKISVIVPVYNGAKFIENALDSIEQQHHDLIEIIVVDDGSTDNTVEICKTREVIVVQQEHKGVAAARNAGVEKASGDFIAFLDADDLWCPDKLESQYKVFQQAPDTSIVLGHSMAVDESTNPLSPVSYVLSLGAMLCRKEVFDLVGNFDETLTFAEDIDWFLKTMEQQCKTVVTQDFVQKFRRHEANMTNDLGTARRFFLHAIKRSLDRRKNAANGEVTPLPQMDMLKPAYTL